MTDTSSDLELDVVKKGRGEAAFVLALVAFLILAGLYMFPGYRTFVEQNWNDLGYDFFYFYSSPCGLNAHISNIYKSQEMIDFKTKLCEGRWRVPLGDSHPPQFYLFYDFFTLFPFKTAYIIHFALSMVLYAFSLYLLLTFLHGRRLLSYILVILLTFYSLVCSVCVDNIFLGQIGFILVFALIMAFYCGERGQWIPAGFFLSVAILFKMFPLFIIFYYIFRKEYKVLISCFSSIAALTLGAGLLWGFHPYLQYMSWMNEQGRKIYISNIKDQYFPNHSIMGFISTVTADHLPTVLLKVIHLSLIALFVVLLYKLCRKAPGHDRIGSAIEYSLYIISATLLTPLSYAHHHIILIIPFISIIALYLRDEHTPRMRVLLTALLTLCALVWLFDGELLTRQWILVLHRDFSNRGLPLISILAMLILTATAFLWSRKETERDSVIPQPQTDV